MKTMAKPVSAGKSASRSLNTSNPPAEAPMPTTGMTARSARGSATPAMKARRPSNSISGRTTPDTRFSCMNAPVSTPRQWQVRAIRGYRATASLLLQGTHRLAVCGPSRGSRRDAPERRGSDLEWNETRHLLSCPTGALPAAAEIRLAPELHDERTIQTSIGELGRQRKHLPPQNPADLKAICR